MVLVHLGTILRLTTLVGVVAYVVDLPLNFAVLLRLDGDAVARRHGLEPTVRPLTLGRVTHGQLLLLILSLHLFEFLDDYGYETACNITQVSEKTNDEIDEISQVLASSREEQTCRFS